MRRPGVGESASISKTVTPSDIARFADVVGDHNPVHFDEAFAGRTPFGRPVAHGMLGASLISAVIGTKLPGPGSIYISQSLRFRAPVYPGDTLTATVTVVRTHEERPLFTLETVCTNQSGDRVITGEAVVLWQPPAVE